MDTILNAGEEFKHEKSISEAKDLVRKLLALANNAGATDHEADAFMTRAASIMAAYNIRETELAPETPSIGRLIITGQHWDIWVMSLVSASATLNACDGATFVYKHDVTGAEFVGREMNREAAKAMLFYLVEQVEREYKAALPRGLSQHERAEFRRTFKLACSRRISTRASNIIYAMKTNNDVAKASTGSTALVVSHSFDEQREEIKEWMNQEGLQWKTRKSRGTRWGNGSEAGRAAGDRIQLQAQLKG